MLLQKRTALTFILVIGSLSKLVSSLALYIWQTMILSLSCTWQPTSGHLSGSALIFMLNSNGPRSNPWDIPMILAQRVDLSLLTLMSYSSPEVRVQPLWGVIRKPEFSEFVYQHIFVSKAFVNLRRLLPQHDLYPKDLLFFQLDANVLAQSIVWAQIQMNAVTGCFFTICHLEAFLVTFIYQV